MEISNKEVMDFIVESLPAICIIGVVAYLAFGGVLADYFEIYTTWLYG